MAVGLCGKFFSALFFFLALMLYKSAPCDENSNNTTEKHGGNLSKITGKSVDTLTTSMTDLANSEIKQNGGDVVEQNGDHVKQNGDTINIISEPSFTNKTYEMNESSQSSKLWKISGDLVDRYSTNITSRWLFLIFSWHSVEIVLAVQLNG